MEVMRTMLVDPVQTAFSAMSQQLGAFIPNLIGAFILLGLGLLFSKTLESVVVRALQAVRLDALAEKMKISDALMRGGITLTFSELLGALAYWFVMFLFLIAMLNALNLTVAAQLFDRIVAYLPNVIAAIFLMGVAIFFASLLSTAARTAASNAGLQQGNFLGQIVQVSIMIFASIMALEQLQLHIVLLHQAILILLAAIGLGFAIALGLGTKDMVGKLVGDLVDRMKSTSRRR